MQYKKGRKIILSSLFLYNRKVLLSYYIKNEDCKGRDVLAVKGGAQ